MQIEKNRAHIQNTLKDANICLRICIYEFSHIEAGPGLLNILQHYLGYADSHRRLGDGRSEQMPKSIQSRGKTPISDQILRSRS